MWIEKQKNGKFKFVEQYEDYLTGKQRRVSVTLEKNTAATRKEALELLLRKIEQVQSSPVAPQDITLESLVEKYRAYQKNAVKPSTYSRNYFSCETLKRLLKPDILVSRLNANYIKDSFLRSGKDNSTLNEHRVRLFALLRWGYENDYMQDISFLRKVKPFKDKSHREKILEKYLEHGEITALLSGMENKRWRLFTEFLILSGLRIGEAIALQKTDIDFKAKVIHITKTFDHNNKLITTPKTPCAVRDVFIQPELEKVCRNILIYIKMESLSKQYRTQLFICNSKGNYINYFSFDKYLKTHAKEILYRKITPHALRHTHASMLLANGVTLDTIARRLGHENSLVTRKVYLHITKQLTKRDNEQIQDIKII